MGNHYSEWTGMEKNGREFEKYETYRLCNNVNATGKTYKTLKFAENKLNQNYFSKGIA